MESYYFVFMAYFPALLKLLYGLQKSSSIQALEMLSKLSVCYISSVWRNRLRSPVGNRRWIGKITRHNENHPFRLMILGVSYKDIGRIPIPQRCCIKMKGAIQVDATGDANLVVYNAITETNESNHTIRSIILTLKRLILYETRSL